MTNKSTSTTEYSPAINALNGIKRQPVERIPVGICLGGSWPIHQVKRNLKDVINNAEETACIFHEIHEKLDVDIIIPGAGATALIARSLGSEVVFDAKGAPQIIKGALEDNKTPDTNALQNLWSDRNIQYLFDSVSALARLNKGKRMILASGRAPFTISGQLLGLERLSRSLYKDKTYAHAVLEWVNEISIGYFTRMLSIDGVDGIFIADPSASGDVISPRHFDEFALPYLQKLGALVKQYGKVSMLHICGDITDRLQRLHGTGIDCISLDAKVKMSLANTLADSKFSLGGNVDPVSVLEFGNPALVKDSVNNCLRDGANIMLPGCDLGYGVPWENIAKFVQTAHNWQKSEVL